MPLAFYYSVCYTEISKQNLQKSVACLCFFRKQKQAEQWEPQTIFGHL